MTSSLKWIAKRILFLTGVLFGLCSNAKTLEALTPIDQVKRYVEQFNQKNIDAMLSAVTNDIAWMYISNDKLVIETKGKEQLATALQNYFKDYQTQSLLLQISSHGQFVQAVEKATWQERDILKSQCSVVTYQLEKELIKAVWYFDSYPC
jgi:hypothetical protein